MKAELYVYQDAFFAFSSPFSVSKHEHLSTVVNPVSLNARAVLTMNRVSCYTSPGIGWDFTISTYLAGDGGFLDSEHEVDFVFKRAR